MKEAYFLHINRKQEGPFSLAEVRDKWRKRHALGITRETPYWQDGLTEWLPLGTLEDTLEPPRTASNSSQPQPASKPKKQTNPLVPALIAIAVVAAGIYFFFLRKGELEGEVFIVTKGGQNYKLGLVTVSLLPLDELTPYLSRKETEATRELDKLQPLIAAAKKERDLAHEAALSSPSADRTALFNRSSKASDKYIALSENADRFRTGEYYLKELPKAILTTQTNADGKFSMLLPIRGNFALAAASSRSVGDSMEWYYWLIKVSMNGSGKKTIMLSNSNLSSTDASDSLIPHPKRNN